MHSIWTRLRGILVPLIMGLLAASSVAPCQAFAPPSSVTVAKAFDPCNSKAPTPAPVSCAQLACQVFLASPTSLDEPILRREDAGLEPAMAFAAGRTFRPALPPPRGLL